MEDERNIKTTTKLLKSSKTAPRKLSISAPHFEDDGAKNKDHVSCLSIALNFSHVSILLPGHHCTVPNQQIYYKWWPVPVYKYQQSQDDAFCFLFFPSSTSFICY